MKNKILIRYRCFIFLLIFGSLSLMTVQITQAASSLPFTDVKESDWYYKDVKSAYEKNLIAGKSKTIYDPNANMTYAEAVKLAACMHQLKKERKITLKAGNPWYQNFVDYAKKNQLIEGDLPWDKVVTRAGYMEIFANVLSASDANKNRVPDGAIPDVSTIHPSAAAIYKLYRAGIVAGVDEQHRCNPAANIKRSEVAAILTRMTDKNKRIAFKMGNDVAGNNSNLNQGGSDSSNQPVANIPYPIVITKQPQDVREKVGNPAVLSVEAKGGKGNISYLWQRSEYGKDDFKVVAFAGNDKAVLNAVVEAKSYVYRCRVSDDIGQKITSDIAYVAKPFNPQDVMKPGEIIIGDNVALNSPLGISQHPTDVSGFKGAPATLKVKAFGGKGKLKYQWERTPLDIEFYTTTIYPGSKSDTLQAEVEDEDYKYRCVITDEAENEIVSSPALVSGKFIIGDAFDSNVVVDIGDIINFDEFKITKQPPKYLVAKNKCDIKVEASGIGLKYQWQKKDNSNGNWKNLQDWAPFHTGCNTDTLKLDFSKGNGVVGEYRCLIKDANFKKLESDAVKLFGNVQKACKGNRPPVILYANRYYVEDEVREVFFVEASGMDESKLSYTWYITDSGGAIWDFATSNEVYTITGQGTPELMIDKTGDDVITFITFQPGAKCEISDGEGNVVEIEMEGVYPPLNLD